MINNQLENYLRFSDGGWDLKVLDNVFAGGRRRSGGGGRRVQDLDLGLRGHLDTLYSMFCDDTNDVDPVGSVSF